MKKIISISAVAAVLLLSAFTVLQSTNWKVNESTYSVSFKAPKVEGIMKGLKANILFDASNPEKSKILATIDATTINTGNGMKNKHAKSEDALNTKQFPEISFVSTSVVKKGSAYEALGKLTMKGITKEISLPFTFENNGNEAIFKGNFSVLARDYNITRSGAPEKFEVELTIPVTK